jgi:hypothetical protein
VLRLKGENFLAVNFGRPLQNGHHELLLRHVVRRTLLLNPRANLLRYISNQKLSAHEWPSLGKTDSTAARHAEMISDFPRESTFFLPAG